MKPLFSIITVTFNANNVIGNVHRSIASQLYDNFEWVVVDGGSTDGTIQFFESICSCKIKFISEPDHGIYDAMNKAVEISCGDYILFLGADDCLADENVLRDFSLHAKEGLPLLLGAAVDGRGKYFVSTLGIKTFIVNTVHHQGAFYKKQLFEKFKYNVKIKAVSDYELNLLCQINKTGFVRANRLIANCGADGVSNSGNEYCYYYDLHKIRRVHIGTVFSLFFFFIGCSNIFLKRLFKW